MLTKYFNRVGITTGVKGAVIREKKKILTDTLLTGVLVWAIGYPIGFYLITIPGYPRIMMEPAILAGMSALIIAVLAGITYLRFHNRPPQPWRYSLIVGSSWLATTVVLDFIFIVLMFNSYAYYQPHILIFYALTLVVPVLAVRYSGRAQNLVLKQ